MTTAPGVHIRRLVIIAEHRVVVIIAAEDIERLLFLDQFLVQAEEIVTQLQTCSQCVGCHPLLTRYTTLAHGYIVLRDGGCIGQVTVHERTAQDDTVILVRKIKRTDGDGSFDILVSTGVQFGIGFTERVAERVTAVAAQTQA